MVFRMTEKGFPRRPIPGLDDGGHLNIHSSSAERPGFHRCNPTIHPNPIGKESSGMIAANMYFSTMHPKSI